MGDGIDNDCDGYIDEDDCSLDSTFSDCAVQVPINGGWAEWGEWGLCQECEVSSTRSRSRECSNPPPQYNGLYCDTTDVGSTLSENCYVSCTPG